MNPFKIYTQEIKSSRSGERFATNEKVNQAIEDIINGNRPLTSRALLQCRLAEIATKRNKENEEFDAWARAVLRVS